MIIICMLYYCAKQAEIGHKQVLQDLIEHTTSKIHLLTNQTAAEGLHTGNIPGIGMWQIKIHGKMWWRL